MPEPRYRKKLNVEQVEVLELLYKFRFGSSDLIARYFGKSSGVFVYKRLKILYDQGYIGKRFDSSYRIKGKPAAYYLSPLGVRALQEHRSPGDEDEVKIKYRDKTLSEDFIEHCLNVFNLYNQLKAMYKDDLTYLTKTDLTGYEDFPKSLPDAFATYKDQNYFFIEVCEESEPFFTYTRKIKQYKDYRDSGNWEQPKFPAILFVCESSSLQKRLQKQLTKAANGLWNATVFASTTMQELKQAQAITLIWQQANDSDEKLSLSQI